MNIKQLPLSDIKPYDKNPRRKKNIEKVMRSIRDFGFQQPIVTDTSGTIIVGHSRYIAAQELKLETVPVIIADLSPEKAKAYRIADNKTNEDSEWDYGLLHKEFTEMLDLNLDLEMTGFDNNELEDFLTFDKEEPGEKIKTEKTCPQCGTKLK